MAFWTDDILAAADLSRAHVLNDSKTPSGRVHVGALRGVLIWGVFAPSSDVRAGALQGDYAGATASCRVRNERRSPCFVTCARRR